MTRIRRKVSDATRYKMRLKKLSTLNPNYGKHDKAKNARISKSMKEYWQRILV